MITGITVNGPGITVYPGYGPKPAVTGMIRWNSGTQLMEVMDGQNWIPINPGPTTIQLDASIQTIIEWANRKIKEEKELEELMGKYPGLKEMHEKFEMMKVLVRDHSAETKK